MIEGYFRAGVRFLWNKPNDAIGATNGDIVASVGAATPLTYDGLDGHRLAVDPMLLMVQAGHVIGLAKGANVAHTWLDYAPGRTARLPVGGGDILSGYMSGCMIARGTYNGAMSVFHVGTIDNNPAVNKIVRHSFARSFPANATGFFPNAAWGPGEIATMQARLGGAGGAPSIFALVTAAGAFHSILMIPVQDPGWTNPAGRKYWCVGGIKAVPAVSRVKLMASLMA
jgi:hypothetical protein